MGQAKERVVRHGSTALLVVLLSAAAVAATTGQPKAGAQRVAAEIRKQIADVRDAMGEATPQRNTTDEVCFRLGGLHATSRHELEEVAETRAGESPRADHLVTQLLKDSRSLPSFCGDLEKAKEDPGYEQVKSGDTADLIRELADMDRRARELAGL